MTFFERAIRDVTAKYRRDKGLPPLKEDITIPESIRKPSIAMRYIGRELASASDPAQRKSDERELRRAYNRKDDE